MLKAKSNEVIMSSQLEASESQKGSEGKSPWFSTTELLEYLGISNKELKRQLKLFQKGTHYKHENPNDPKSRILWRVDLIDEVLCLPVPPLEREAMINAINNHIICDK